jgi:hypothetical protein
MNMSAPDFDVVISGGNISQDAWLKAGDVRKPELGAAQTEGARKMRVSEEDYARGVVALQLGEEIQRDRGRKLGQRIQEILEPLGSGYALSAVIRQGTEDRWIARIAVAEKLVAVVLPLDLVDDVIDSGAVQDMNRLKNLVLFGVGRQELILKH